MLKNGRPYTNENGCDDASLISRHSYAVRLRVEKWIKENLRPSKDVYTERSSYSLKHILENDTGIYLTNNEFKDALFISGFEPENVNEVNWHFKLIYLKEDGVLVNPFVKWLDHNFSSLSKVEQDFARDAIAKDSVDDNTFPLFADKKTIQEYLDRITTLNKVTEIFEGLWKKYEKTF